MVIDLYLLVLGHTKYKGIDLSTKYKVTVPSTKYFLHSYMYLVLGGKYKVQSTWPKVLGPSSITKVTVKYLVTQLQLLYLTQLCIFCTKFCPNRSERLRSEIHWVYKKL